MMTAIGFQLGWFPPVPSWVAHTDFSWGGPYMFPNGISHRFLEISAELWRSLVRVSLGSLVTGLWRSDALLGYLEKVFWIFEAP